MTISASNRLKELRQTAVPSISIRAMADAVGIGHSRYSYFEDPKRYKKPYLPIDLTRSIAAVLSERGVDPAEVMKLAGLEDAEAEPEARAVEAARPTVQYFAVQAVMPSEAALAAMFETLLALIPEEATKAEAARILAQQLPVGFAAIGPAATPQHPASATAGTAAVPADAKDDRAPPPPSRN